MCAHKIQVRLLASFAPASSNDEISSILLKYWLIPTLLPFVLLPRYLPSIYTTTRSTAWKVDMAVSAFVSFTTTVRDAFFAWMYFRVWLRRPERQRFSTLTLTLYVLATNASVASLILAFIYRPFQPNTLCVVCLPLTPSSQEPLLNVTRLELASVCSQLARNRSGTWGARRSQAASRSSPAPFSSQGRHLDPPAPQVRWYPLSTNLYLRCRSRHSSQRKLYVRL